MRLGPEADYRRQCALEAMKVMLAATLDKKEIVSRKLIAETSYAIADAMIEQDRR